MPTGHSQNVEEALELERGAHETKVALLSDPAFIAGLESAIEDERAGRVMSLVDFKRELGVS